jgi:hypothetical protein
VLAPGGRLYLFEHNPYHPVTRWVVRHTPIDKHAILATPAQVRGGLHAAGFFDMRTRFLLFLPPRWCWTSRFEKWLGWLPAGGQYVVTGCKTAVRSRG